LVGWFKIDQQRIAATLCVQKETPENTCQGNCHMNKVLKSVESGSEDGTVPERTMVEVKEIQMLFEGATDYKLNVIEERLNDRTSCNILQGFKQDFFRPPMV